MKGRRTMRAILISIKPKWVEKILNGEKTIEIRKTCPEIFKHLKPYEGCSIDVYIYCTKDKPYLAHATELITGKYGCISNDEVSYEEHNLNGKVIAKFTLNKVEEIICRPICGEWESYTETLGYSEISQASCLGNREIVHYLKGKNGYAWHISNLEIFDKPKKLSEFKHCTEKICIYGKCHKYMHCLKPLTKAPQSWQFIEVE